MKALIIYEITNVLKFPMNMEILFEYINRFKKVFINKVNYSNSIPNSSLISLSKSGRCGSTQWSLLSIPAAFT